MARDPKQDNPSFSSAAAIAATKLQRLGTGVRNIPKGSGSRPVPFLGRLPPGAGVPSQPRNTSWYPKLRHITCCGPSAACTFVNSCSRGGITLRKERRHSGCCPCSGSFCRFSGCGRSAEGSSGSLGESLPSVRVSFLPASKDADQVHSVCALWHWVDSQIPEEVVPTMLALWASMEQPECHLQ